MASHTSDVLIIGGGIIGCSTAYYCARAGLSVTLLEAETIAAGASGAAAGMLASQVEAHQPDELFEFSLAARAVHAQLAETLRSEIGVDVEYRVPGVLRLALEDREAVDLRGRQKWQEARGLRAEWLDAPQVAAAEPLLRGAASWRLAGALHLPDEAQVRSPRLVRALAEAASKRGARVLEGTPVTEVVATGDRIEQVNTAVGSFAAGTVVLSAGAWSGRLAYMLGLYLPVQPIKGQIVALDGLLARPQHILWSGGCYLTPKSDGQIIVGSTEEHSGFDRRPTLSALLQLATGATDISARFGSLPVAQMWAGLRPALPDRYPAMGRAPGFRNLIVATGHFRNGVLLGPLTGQIMTEILCDQSPSWDLTPFQLERLVPPGHAAQHR